jgi:CRISPR-associated protein Csb1
MNPLDLISGPYAAIRLTQRLQPAGGPGSKVFPPTFEGGVYCFEKRRIGATTLDCVLLDGVASSANRQEEALAALVDDGALKVPRFISEFEGFPELGEVSTLTAPHRAFDAIFRDSELGGKAFNKTPLYAELSKANAKNATALLQHAPTALLFGAWDSTGSAGGLGNKFARCIVTELIGVNVERGETRGGLRLDPLAISRNVEIEVDKAGDWKPKGIVAKKEDGKKEERAKGTRPSEVNHGNVLAKVEYEGSRADGRSLKGGVTCEYALQLSVITLSGLRRLRFPINGKLDPKVDDAARAVLATLGLVAITASRDRGYALRSRCDLVAEGLAEFEVVAHDGSATKHQLDTKAAIALYQAAVERATKLGLPWNDEPTRMKPQDKLVKLVKLSRDAGVE